jgi:hypothetical protein
MDETDLERLRAIPLDAVLERFGARRAANDRKHNWKLPGSRITVHGALFYDHVREAGGQGAIDLACHLGGFGFREALDWLAAGTFPPPRSSNPAPLAAPRVIYPVPPPDPGQLERVRAYLTDTRAIPAPIVARAIATRQLYADARGNAVFVLRDQAMKPVGVELRGSEAQPFHRVAGARKGLFFARMGKSREAAFVESAIEALSYLALRPGRLAISTTGNAVTLPEAMAQRLLGLGYRLHAAFNADAEGDRMAARLIAQSGGRMQRDRPVGAKDWNDLLVAARQSRSSPEHEHALAR